MVLQLSMFDYIIGISIYSVREIYLGCVNTVESTLLIYPENTKEKDFDPFE